MYMRVHQHDISPHLKGRDLLAWGVIKEKIRFLPERKNQDLKMLARKSCYEVQ
jgi:hypothetical protein